MPQKGGTAGRLTRPWRVTTVQFCRKNRSLSASRDVLATGSIVAQLFSTMTPKLLLIVASLVAMAPVQALYAQDERAEGDKPRATVRSQDGGREATGPVVGQAVERSAPTPAPPPRSAPPQRIETRAASAPAAAAASAAAEDQRRRDRDGGRDRGDNPAVGRAVPRDSRPAPPPTSNAGRNEPRYRSGGVYVRPPAYNYYSYPRRYYPYGYGAFGLGYFYYDPYTWYPPSSYSGYYGSGGYYDPFYGDSFFHDIGELRLNVSPRNADVYVDGYFSGRVDDYDGVFQALKLDAGPHHIQIVAPGLAPLDFDVRIEPNRKITYRGTLQPFRP